LPVSAILQELRSRYPLFANYLRQQREITDNLMIGNGGLELRLDSIVEPGQELVLVTPVSGG
jgi:molybdopterin converting factor small subunit